MIEVSASKFRNNIFSYLDKAAQGETIAIIRNNKDVAHIVPTIERNWRERMTQEITFNVSSEELIAPIEDIWEDYV